MFEPLLTITEPPPHLRTLNNIPVNIPLSFPKRVQSTVLNSVTVDYSLPVIEFQMKDIYSI